FYNGNVKTASEMLQKAERRDVTLGDLKEIVFKNDDTVLFEYLCQREWLSVTDISNEDIGTIVVKDAREIMNYLFQNGYRFSDHKGASNEVLNRAIMFEREEMLDLLLANAADPSEDGELGYPLIESCQSGDSKTIEKLLSYGADLDKCGEAAMQNAVVSANLDAVKRLIEHGVKISETTYKDAKEAGIYKNDHTREFVKKVYESQK
ncbi:ankyrin repeat domain-containing protein, partial [Brotonthovivens ammoniilytica]